MPGRGRDGRAAQASAADSVDHVAVTRQSRRGKEIDLQDARTLARLGTDHYTRVPLLGEPVTTDMRYALVFRGPDGCFTRMFFEHQLTPEEVSSLLPELREHNATFSAAFAPRQSRGQA